MRRAIALQAAAVAVTLTGAGPARAESVLVNEQGFVREAADHDFYPLTVGSPVVLTTTVRTGGFDAQVVLEGPGGRSLASFVVEHGQHREMRTFLQVPGEYTIHILPDRKPDGGGALQFPYWVGAATQAAAAPAPGRRQQVSATDPKAGKPDPTVENVDVITVPTGFLDSDAFYVRVEPDDVKAIVTTPSQEVLAVPDIDHGALGARFEVDGAWGSPNLYFFDPDGPRPVSITRIGGRDWQPVFKNPVVFRSDAPPQTTAYPAGVAVPFEPAVKGGLAATAASLEVYVEILLLDAEGQVLAREEEETWEGSASLDVDASLASRARSVVVRSLSGDSGAAHVSLDRVWRSDVPLREVRNRPVTLARSKDVRYSAREWALSLPFPCDLQVRTTISSSSLILVDGSGSVVPAEPSGEPGAIHFSSAMLGAGDALIIGFVSDADSPVATCEGREAVVDQEVYLDGERHVTAAHPNRVAEGVPFTLASGEVVEVLARSMSELPVDLTWRDSSGVVVDSHVGDLSPEHPVELRFAPESPGVYEFTMVTDRPSESVSIDLEVRKGAIDERTVQVGGEVAAVDFRFPLEGLRGSTTFDAPGGPFQVRFSPGLGEANRLRVEDSRGTVLLDQFASGLALDELGGVVSGVPAGETVTVRGEALGDVSEVAFELLPVTLAEPSPFSFAAQGIPELPAAARPSAPDFLYHDADGAERNISSLRGRVVVLDFWYTGCGPCRFSLPRLQALATSLSKAPVTFLGVNSVDDPATIANTVRQLGLTFWTISASDAIFELFHVNAVPRTIVIGSDGGIIGDFTGAGHDDDIATAVRDGLRALDTGSTGSP